MRPRQRTTLLTALVLACLAWASTSARAQSEAPEYLTVESIPSEPIIEVLSIGDAPRRLLRFDIAEGSTEELSITMKMSMTQSIEDAPGVPVRVPAITIPSVTQVTAVEDGRVSYSASFGAADIEGNGPAKRSLEVEMEGLDRTTMSATALADGTHTDVTVQIPEDASDMLKLRAEQMRVQAEISALRLPREQIGVGAVWRCDVPAVVENMQCVFRSTCTLRSIEGNTLHIDVQNRQFTPPQTVESTVDPTATVRVVDARSAGAGWVAYDLTRINPVSGLSKSASKIEMVVMVGEFEQPMSVTTKTEMAIESSPRE